MARLEDDEIFARALQELNAVYGLHEIVEEPEDTEFLSWLTVRV